VSYIAGLLERLDFAKAGFSITIHPVHDVRKNALMSVLYTCLAPDTRPDPKTMQTVLFFLILQSKFWQAIFHR